MTTTTARNPAKHLQSHSAAAKSWAAIQHPTPDDIAVLCAGLDWLEVSTHNMLCAEILTVLDDARLEAKAKQEPHQIELTLPLVSEDGTPGLDVGNVPFFVAPHGIGHGFDLVLRNDDLIIMARRSPSALKTMPNVRVHFRNTFLHRMDWTRAYDQMRIAMLTLLDRTPTPEFIISRCDLFLDCQGINLEHITKDHWIGQPRLSIADYRTGKLHTGFSLSPDHDDREQDLWSKATGSAKSYRRGEATGMAAGRGSPISMRVYDKTEEISKKSGKWWMFDVWRESPQFDETKARDSKRMKHPVVRVEFQLRRERLDDFRLGDQEGTHQFLPRGIRTVEQLALVMPQLWRYLCGDKVPIINSRGNIVQRPGWISLRQPNGKRPTTWPEHPWWTAVRTHLVAEEPLRRVKSIKLTQASSLLAGAAGAVAGVAGRFAVHSGGDPAIIAQTILHEEMWAHNVPKHIARQARAIWDALPENRRSGMTPQQMERAMLLYQEFKHAGGLCEVDQLSAIVSEQVGEGGAVAARADVHHAKHSAAFGEGK